MKRGTKYTMDFPETLFHYTSLNTLALILENRTICFNSLLNVDDVEEAETSDLGMFGKYVYVSCWTDESKESIAMWQMYTPNMHGVRIQLPAFPFKKHHYKAGELHFKADTESYLDLKKLYDDNIASIVAELPKLIPVTYTSDEALLRPKVRFGDTIDNCNDVVNRKSTGNQSRNIRYDLENLGKFKKDDWCFQKEWRYWISMSPWGLKEAEFATPSTHIEFVRRLENKDTQPPYKRFFVELSDEAISQIKVVFGPRMTEAEKILAKHLLAGYGLGDKWCESTLRIR